MSKFYADPNPIGVNPPSDHDRQPILKVIGGDTVVIETIVQRADGVPATVDNSILTFALRDQKFSSEPIWEARWYSGIMPVGGVTPGRVQIKIPADITDTLRRGSFVYSLRVSDKLGNDVQTVLTGSLLVEYAPTSPTHNIPYKPES